MTCGHCEKRVKAAAERVNGVKSAKADFVKGEVTIACDANTSVKELKKAIREAGYKVK